MGTLIVAHTYNSSPWYEQEDQKFKGQPGVHTRARTHVRVYVGTCRGKRKALDVIFQVLFTYFFFF